MQELSARMNKPNNVIRVPLLKEEAFFKYWFEFLQPFHHLAKKERLVLTNLALERFRIGKVVSDNDMADKMLFSHEKINEIIRKSEISAVYFKSVMAKLRKIGIFSGRKMNPRFMPIYSGEKDFSLLITFSIDAPK